MKTFEEITAILDTVTESVLDAIDDAWYDSILTSGKAHKAARKSLLSNLKKIGLTEDEYDVWVNT